jgi:methyltransferase
VVSGIAIGYGLLGLVAAERVAELALSARNARRTLAQGGVEVGEGHYRSMVIFHGAFLAACAAEPLALETPRWPVAATLGAAGAVLLAQTLRWWAIATLGARWSTRVVVLPGAAPVRAGPYRLLRHPNYVAVALELAALPLALGAWRTALAAAVGNALLMAVRIPAEERAVYGPATAREPGGPPVRPERSSANREPGGTPVRPERSSAKRCGVEGRAARGGEP